MCSSRQSRFPPMSSSGRHREWGERLVFNFPSVRVLLSGHILAVTAAPLGRTGAFYIWLSPHGRAEGLSGGDLGPRTGAVKACGSPGVC